MKRIPYTLPDDGFRERKGYVYLDAGELVIEVEDALFGEFDRDTHMFRIELAALERVDIETGFLKDHLLVKPKADELLDKMPGSRGGYVDLPVWRRHREALRSLVRLIGLAGP